jgi:translation initiation factor IF-3
LLRESAIRDARTNRRIRARELRVIGPEGEQLGVLPLEAALAKAAELGLDLVEVSPMAKPPVCKIMDYGKHKYQEKKRANEAKKKQTVVKLKEIKFRPKTEEHDYLFKTRQVREFLEEGNKARITVMFRGREITHREIGQAILRRIEVDLKDIAVVEQPARLEGRFLFMILSANPRTLQAIKQREAAAEKAALPAGAAAAAAAPAGAAPAGAAPAGAAPAGVAPAAAAAPAGAAPAAAAAAPVKPPPAGATATGPVTPVAAPAPAPASEGAKA